MIPYHPALSDLAKELRDRQTLAEKKMWEEVRKRKILGYKFIRQKPLLSYVADFYCQKLLLIVELDGEIHNERKEYDAYRTAELMSIGMTVIRYTNDQVLNDLPRVMNHLKRVMIFFESHPKEMRWVKK